MWKAINSMIRNNDINIAPYEVIRDGYQYKFDANENIFDFDDNNREQIKKIIDEFEFRRYPDCASKTVKSILTTIHNDSSQKNFLVGNGSDEILYYLFSLYRDKKIVLLDIDYAVYYHLAKLFNMQVIKVELTKEMDIDEKWNIEIMKNEADLVILSYPNNPLGKCMNHEQIVQAIENNKNTFFVIDEAYYHFSGKTFEKDISKWDNLAIIRTFSKAFSMASLRLGYIYSQTQNIELLNKYKLPFNVTSLTQQIFVNVYQNLKDGLEKQVLFTKNEKERVMQIIAEKYDWLKIYTTETNFLFCKCTNVDFKEFQQILLQNSLHVSCNYANKRVESCFRYSLGKKEENDFFLEILEKFNTIKSKYLTLKSLLN